MIPLFEKEGLLICFEALPEDISAKDHFMKECGWTYAQFKPIAEFDWFCAKVSAWKDGEEVGTSYLGCCSYKYASDFYTKHKDEYFADMVKDAIDEAKEKSTGKSATPTGSQAARRRCSDNAAHQAAQRL